MKRIFLTIILLVCSKSVTFWKEVGGGSPTVMSMSLTGPKQGHIVQGDASLYRVFQMDAGDGALSSIKHIDVGSNQNIVTDTRIQSDSGFNVVAASNTLFRFNAEPGANIDFEEYSVPTGNKYEYPVWAPQTNYMFVGTRDFTTVPGKKFYRLHSDRITDVKIFDVRSNTRSYGVLYGTSWLVISVDNGPHRRLFDYTNGYIGGSNSVVQTHSRPHAHNEIGFISPEDGRGYYVVGIDQWDGVRRIYTVKNDGTDHLNRGLSSLSHVVNYMKWVKDTDLCVVGSWGNNFAIVNFMDTSNPAPAYYTLHGGGEQIYQPQVFKDYKAIILSARITSKSYVYKALDEMPCSELCGTCDGILRKKCLSCPPHSTKSGEVCSCDFGYYSNNISPYKKECLACSALCGTCTGNGPNQCLTCRYPYTEKKGDGSCGCPDGKYLSGTSCLDCDPSCKTCSGAGPSACLSCEVSTGRYLSGSQCPKCDITCKTCSGGSPNECLSCDLSSSRYFSSNSCAFFG